MLASLLRTYLVQLYVIPTESMTPTINVQDRVLVVKDDIINLKYQIGDIVVFYNPLTYSQKSYLDKFLYSLEFLPFNRNEHDFEQAYIKRIIGLPGDEIVIDNSGNIYRNNEILSFEGLVNETLTKQEKYNVPNNFYFLLGDNRGNSQDSRIFGYVPVENLIGKAFYKVYPFENIQKLND